MQHAQKIRFFAPHFVIERLQITSPTNVPETRFSSTVKKVDAYYLTREAVVEFANCLVEVDAVTRFTNRFGPLWITRTDKRFSFRLLDWEAARRQFRWTWDRLLGLPTRDVEIPPMFKPIKKGLQRTADAIRRVDVTAGQFELTADRVMIFIADSLYQALVLKLLSLSEAGKLRRCARPDCDNLPYFIAEHGKQQFCGEKCSEWGQRLAKAAWWKEKGESWRASRRKGKRGKKDGTRKAR
jgi:hypothetical protein